MTYPSLVNFMFEQWPVRNCLLSRHSRRAPCLFSVGARQFDIKWSIWSKILKCANLQVRWFGRKRCEENVSEKFSGKLSETMYWPAYRVLLAICMLQTKSRTVKFTVNQAMLTILQHSLGKYLVRRIQQLLGYPIELLGQTELDSM